MGESKLSPLESLLESMGIKYRSTSTYLQTYWKDKKLNQILIILFQDEEWVSISSILEHNKIKSSFNCDDEFQLINKLNLHFSGFKFVIDKANHLLIWVQIPYEFLTSEYLLDIFKKMVYIINELYN